MTRIGLHRVTAREGMLRVLMRQERVSHDEMRRAYDPLKLDYECNDNNKRQLVRRLRLELRPLGVEIENIWGWGYRISPEGKARVRASLTKSQPSSVNLSHG